jgi:hypothetical protein
MKDPVIKVNGVRCTMVPANATIRWQDGEDYIEVVLTKGAGLRIRSCPGGLFVKPSVSNEIFVGIEELKNDES